MRSVLLVTLLVACSDEKTYECQGATAETEFVTTMGCDEDFVALASKPLDATIPSARSVKTILDREGGSALYFQNSNLFETHYEFASTHLSGNGLPIVPMLAVFNTTEYFSPSRRFVLGALTHYEQPDKWVYEISPYDTASAALITETYTAIAQNAFIGDELYFHPTSEAIAEVAADLPANVKIISTAELFEGITYQPLNIAESYGQVRFYAATALSSGQAYLSFRDIAVLDTVPNDISVAMGIITDAFQTPLSHVNVLSKNRGTPNMALAGAFTDPELRSLEGKWVRLSVSAYDYTVEEVTKEVADIWWDENRPSTVQVPGADLAATDLRDDTAIIDLADTTRTLKVKIKEATRAYGGKAAHFGALSQIEGVPHPKGFGIPLYYYFQFMQQNGFDVRVQALLADAMFVDDAATRDRELARLRAEMMTAPVDPAFEAMLLAKLNGEFANTRMKFRSSTNAEDLDGFTGAGLYTSIAGDPSDEDRPVLDAIREVWSSVWYFKAFEERSYRGIDHTAVGMAMLVHRSFPNEEANGVALTNNPYDKSGLVPAFYINAQLGGASVVLPAAGVSTDQFLHYFEQSGQPVVFIARSNLTSPGTNVLSAPQILALSTALDKLHEYFRASYGAGVDWYAMDVEWKFDGEPGQVPSLYIKQARPYQ
jgi:hypothetical protein